MDANRPAGNPQGQSHGVAVEPDRVSTKVVVGFGVVLAVVGVVGMILMAILFRSLEKGERKKDAAVMEAAGLQRRLDTLPPQPRLQVYPVRHWKEFQAAEEERLTTYGWMDRSTGAVRVPIDRAIELVAERGLGPLPAAPMAMPEVKK